MARYMIVSARCEVGEGEMACGPVSGPVIAEVQLRSDSGEEFYMGNAEVTGLCNFYKTDRTMLDVQLSVDMSDEDIEYMEKHMLTGGDYEEIFEEKDPEWYQVYRYLIYLTRADWDDVDAFVKETTGKYIDEIEVPMSDVEEDYIEMMEEEEEE